MLPLTHSHETVILNKMERQGKYEDDGNNEAKLFELIQTKGEKFRPALLFLIGVNYGKFSSKYS